MDLKMVEYGMDEINKSYWLNWCRLCGSKEDIQGNVKICTNDKENTGSSVLVMAIRKYFDVHMHAGDELGGVLCKECYTLINELLDFAEHVTKAQAIFEVLRRSEPSNQLEVEALRQQYGLHDGNWRHFIKLVPDKKNNAGKTIRSVDKRETDKAVITEQLPEKSPEEVLYSSCTAFDQTANKEISLSIDSNIDKIKSEEETEIEVTQYSISEAFNFSSIDEDMANTSSTVDSEKHPPPLYWVGNLREIAPNIENIKLMPIEEVIVSSRQARSHKRNNPISGKEKRIKGCTKRKLNTKSEIKKIKLRCDDDTECSQTITPSSITPNIKQKNSQDLASRDTTKSGFNTSSSKSIEQKGTHDLSAKNTTESDLKALSSESGKKNKLTYRCDLCNKTLSNATALKMHKQVMHVKSTPFMCDDCGKQFKTKPALKEHKLVHTEERPYVCTTCNGAFKSQGRLNRHLQIHSEPTYECEICGKKLQTRDTLLNHKNVHTKARRYKCTVCGTVTSSSTTLKHHLLSHAGIRSYSCKYCNKEFICATDVKKHKKKMHPVEYERDEDQSCRVANVPTLKELRALAVALGKREPLRKPKNK